MLTPSMTYEFSSPDDPPMEGLPGPVPRPDTTPGAIAATSATLRPSGSLLTNSSGLKLSLIEVLFVSTRGRSEVTMTASSPSARVIGSAVRWLITTLTSGTMIVA